MYICIYINRFNKKKIWDLSITGLFNFNIVYRKGVFLVHLSLERSTVFPLISTGPQINVPH